MSREYRLVPADWKHPKDADGHYVPLFGGDLAKLQAKWDVCEAKWNEGLREDFHHEGYLGSG